MAEPRCSNCSMLLVERNDYRELGCTYGFDDRRILACYRCAVGTHTCELHGVFGCEICEEPFEGQCRFIAACCREAATHTAHFLQTYPAHVAGREITRDVCGSHAAQLHEWPHRFATRRFTHATVLPCAHA